MGEKRTSLSLVVASLAFVGSTAVSTPTFAHHRPGTAYDQNRTIAVKGKVTEISWKHPHSALFVDVTDGPFKGRNYAVELNSPGAMIRQGLTEKQFRVGDEVVINVHPSKNGSAVGECLTCALVVNGKVTKLQ